MKDSWREITLGVTHIEFGDNSFKSSKYTLLTFWPAFVIDKLRKTLTLWFLLVSLLQLLFPDLHEWDPWSTLVFFGGVISMSLIKEIGVEVAKLVQDSAINNQLFTVWSESDFVQMKRKDLHAGQIIKLSEGDVLPADCVLLATSRRDMKCFVNLRKLTGKKDPDEKTTLSELAVVSENFENDPKVVERVEGTVEAPLPNPDFSSFQGTLKLRGFPRGIKLSIKQFLPGGAILVNTAWILGIIVYVGKETKSLLNREGLSRKSSKLSSFTNWASSAIIVGTIIFSLICAAVADTQMERDDRNLHFGDFLVGFLVTYQRAVPITLFMMMGLSRILFRTILSSRCRITNAKVLDNLGYVEYILTGKSGVVTTGRLTLKVCLIGSNEYWNELSQKVESDDCEDKTKIIAGTSATYNGTTMSPIDGMFADFPEEASHMMYAMLLCCSTKTNKAPFESAQSRGVLEGARSYGYTLHELNNDEVVMTTPAGQRGFEMMFSFISEDTTYILVKSNLNDRCWLYVKGTIMNVEKFFKQSEDDLIRLDQLLAFSRNKGLHIKVFAYKEILLEEAKELQFKADCAKDAAVNVEGRIKDALEEVIVGLRILGAAGLQDDLYPFISDTLNELSRAGAKIWVVSTEEETTVTSCGMSLGLISADSQVINLSGIDSQFHLKRTLIKGIRRYIFDAEGLPFSNQNTLENDAFTPRKLNKLLNLTVANPTRTRIYKSLSIKGNDVGEVLEEPFDTNEVNFSVLIDGMTFNTAIRDPECRRLLTCLLFPSTSVFAFEFMPMQKAELVRLLQDNLDFKPVVLAIGEGDKDGAMMREADVGLLMEGSKSIDADLIIKNFSSLVWLINQRGRQISASLTRMVCLALYKNLAFTLVLFYYNFISDYSGTQLYSPLMAEGLDLFFTSLPLIVVATDPVSRGMKLSMRLILVYLLKAAVHSGIVFLFMASVSETVLNDEGSVMTVSALGLFTYVALMLAFYFQVLIEAENNFVLACAACILSAGLMFICFVYAYPSDFVVITSSPSALIAMFFAALTCAAVSLIAMMCTAHSTHAKIIPFTTSNKSRLENYKESLGTVYSNTRGWKSDDETEAFVIDPVKLTFSSTNTEHIYNVGKVPTTIALIRIFLLVCGPLFACWLILIYFVKGLPKDFVIYRACMVGLILLTWALTYTNLRRYNKSSTLFLCILANALMFVFVIMEDSTTEVGFALAIIFTSLIFFVNFHHVVMLVILSIVLSLVADSINSNYGNSVKFCTLFLEQFTILLALGLVTVAGGYSIEKNSRERFRLRQITRLEVEKSQAILGFLLPAFVKDRVREGARYIAEDQGTVSILFCDIYDFDRVSAEYSPKELTDFLDNLFRKFDYLCDAHGVTKIETVGKTYMACAGLRDSEIDLPLHLISRSHARRVTDMALDIIRTCSTRKLKNGQPLQVKIGLNSGPVTAGVVGFHKPQFSLVGDTVNTASRMCSTLSTTNGIQMTVKTFDLLGDISGLAFTDSSVEAKGKGLLDTKLVYEDLHFKSEPTIHLKSLHTITRRTHRSSIIEDSNQMLLVKGTEMVNDILSFTCKDSAKQADFRAKFIQQHLVLIQLGLLAGCALSLSMCALNLAQLFELDNYATPSLVICRGIVAAAYFGIWLLPTRVSKKIQFRWATTIVTIAHVVVAFINLIEDTKEPHGLVLIEAMFVVVFWSNCSGCFFMHIIPINLAIFILWLVLDPWVSDPLNFIGHSVCLLLVILINLWVAYSRESNSRDFANLQMSSMKEIERTEKLVTQMMPARVYENLKNDRELTEKLEGICLLFADIVGFTAWSSNKLPVEVVGMLSEMFTRFDRMTVEFSVYKVHTIGDCYVVMSDTNLGIRNPINEVKNMIEFAFEMLEAIRQINAEHDSELNMRIGVHFGEIIAGITGTNIVRYDIYGSDVLIANKMESGGQAGRLNVSDIVRELIIQGCPDDYDFEFNAEIEAKSVNRKHKSFFVSPRVKS